MRRGLLGLLVAGLMAAAPAASAAARVGPADFAKVVPGKTTQAEARALLGPPAIDMWLRAEQRQGWGYRYAGDFERRVFWLEWSSDGLLHKTSDAPDFEAGRYRGP